MLPLPRSRRSTPFPRLLLGAALALLVPALALAQANGKLQIHHVNVGQGDGILLISPLGETAFFDDGTYTSCSGIISFCQGLGITSVNYHFCSHYHATIWGASTTSRPPGSRSRSRATIVALRIRALRSTTTWRHWATSARRSRRTR